MSLDSPSKLPLLYALAFRQLKLHSEAGFVSFRRVDATIWRIELSHDERVCVMKELEAAGTCGAC